jgi:7-carboxy-7-deazaguanine synthase
MPSPPNNAPVTVSLQQIEVPPADPRSLPIAETFYSIQGEGKLVGTPSFFIRVSGCNLRCVWCDTPYASWNPETTTKTLDELVQLAAHSKSKHVVITGGEPMIFAQLDALCTKLKVKGHHITIETAGTVYKEVLCDLLSVSPKLANSTPISDARDPEGIWTRRHEERRLQPKVLQQLLDHYPDRQLKFVVSGEGDIPEIENILAKLKGWDKDDVLLMPEGTSPPLPRRKAWLTKTCLQRGWRYCGRLHLELFGHKRGT